MSVFSFKMFNMNYNLPYNQTFIFRTGLQPCGALPTWSWPGGRSWRRCRQGPLCPWVHGMRGRDVGQHTLCHVSLSSMAHLKIWHKKLISKSKPISLSPSIPSSRMKILPADEYAAQARTKKKGRTWKKLNLSTLFHFCNRFTHNLCIHVGVDVLFWNWLWRTHHFPVLYTRSLEVPFNYVDRK